MNRSPLRRALRGLGLVLYGLIVAAAIGEVIVRLVPAPGDGERLPLSYNQVSLDFLATPESILKTDADLGWVPRPGLSQPIGWYGPHNLAGMRAEREYSPRPGPGVRRILAYGDSFTYCDDVEQPDCWTHQLEQHADAEVLNFGVPGYAPDQAWLRYQRGGSTWQSCSVLIGVMPENINRMLNRFRPFYSPHTGIPLPKPRFLLDGDGLRLLPSPAYDIDKLRDPRWVEANLSPNDPWYFPGVFVANPLDRFELVRVARTAAYNAGRNQAQEFTYDYAVGIYRPEAEAFTLLSRVLVGFAQEVQADGATPVVLIHPYRSAIVDGRDGRPKPHAPLIDKLQQQGIAVLDLTDVLGVEARRRDIRDLFRGHYTPAANMVVAMALAERLPALTAETCGPV